MVYPRASLAEAWRMRADVTLVLLDGKASLHERAGAAAAPDDGEVRQRPDGTRERRFTSMESLTGALMMFGGGRPGKNE